MPNDLNRFNGQFGRPFVTGTEEDLKLYARTKAPITSPHPGYYDDANERYGERANERQMPHRDKKRPTRANLLFNSIGMYAGEGELFGIEDARASLTITPGVAAAIVTAPIILDRDLILDGGIFPSEEPGAAIYLGIRSFSATAVATTATGAIAWAAQVGPGPFLALGTTPASPVSYYTNIHGFVPYPLNADRVPVGTSIGLLAATSDTVAAPVAIRATLSFSLLFSIPYDR